MNKTRAEIITDAVRIRADIEQTFLDVAYWNAEVRKPHEPPIDPDPGGDMRRLHDGLSKMLALEAARPLGVMEPIPQCLPSAEEIRGVLRRENGGGA